MSEMTMCPTTIPSTHNFFPPLAALDSCPNCVFAYADEEFDTHPQPQRTPASLSRFKHHVLAVSLSTPVDTENPAPPGLVNTIFAPLRIQAQGPV